MRWLALVLIGCHTTETPAPAPAVPLPPTPSASAVASSVPDVDAARDVVVPLVDDGLGGIGLAVPGLGGIGLAVPSPALLERLNREWNAVPKGKLEIHPKPDPERDAFIQKRFGEDCSLERTCGPLWGIDCHAATDGPYYYVQIKPDRVESITICGGACMGNRCTNCPPKKEGWTCPTY